ncbi:MAG: DNA primase, partial [Clostridia bacterium]|nr:DNA primase [Clostridia bacterium]
KSKNDIVDVVSRYCSLAPRGGSFWACCPLPGHSERTASFHVNQYGQFYKCFGCGRGGDAITFVMEMESLNYVEAVKLLAEKANMTLPESFKDERRTSEDYRKKEVLLSIMRDSARFYVANLRSGKAEAHEAYVKKRGLEKNTVTAFGIGASLDYNSLPEYLKSKGYSYADMVAAGVVTEREFNGRTEYSDSEAKRLIFPIISAMGDVIAFGGRVLEKTDFGKYKNTRETPLFVKNKTLYNINQIKKQKAAGPLKEIIIVEGYMDTVSLYSAGFINVVASMGTSLTKEQARLLKRYTENVLICYDGDFAGQAANIRGLEILKAEGLNVKVVSLPEGMDPDDVIQKYGAEGYRKCLDEAMPLVDFKLKILRDRFFDGTAEGRRRYIAEAVKVISESPSEAEREELLRNVSRETGITYQSLKRDMDKSPESLKNEKKQIFSQKAASRLVQAERFVLARALWSSVRPLKDVHVLDGLSFSDGYRMEIASYVRDFLNGGLEIKPSLLYDYMGEDGRDEAEEVLNCLEMPVIGDDTEDKFFNDCIRLIKTEALGNKLKELKERADGETDAAKRSELAREIMNVTAEIRKL